MTVEITLECPKCNQSEDIVKNGINKQNKQNYRCNRCNRQFIAPHELSYRGCQKGIAERIKYMLVRRLGIRDIAELEGISVKKVLSTLEDISVKMKPSQSYYDSLEVDELWSYVKKKSKKYWLIYAYCRQTGEIVSWAWGKRDRKTVQQLWSNLKSAGVRVKAVCTDNWEAFKGVFKGCKHLIGKCFTKGIEGNNCRLRHRVSRLIRRTCCFSKKKSNHRKACELAFFYINNACV